jgi:hypothetical protein
MFSVEADTISIICVTKAYKESTIIKSLSIICVPKEYVEKFQT